jgi:hypothetical protein
MVAVVMGWEELPEVENEVTMGRDGRRWLSRDDSLTDGEGKRKGGATMNAMPKTARKKRNWKKGNRKTRVFP